MKKNFTPIHKHLHQNHSAVHEKNSVKRKNSHQSIGLFITGFFLYLFVSLNIFASQSTVPSQYFSFVTENQQAVSHVLQRIQYLPEYPAILASQREIYGSIVDESIMKENRARSTEIAYLEMELQKNTKSRDILYALSILYKENGNMSQSQTYLRKAQEIDPSLRD